MLDRLVCPTQNYCLSYQGASQRTNKMVRIFVSVRTEIKIESTLTLGR